MNITQHQGRLEFITSADSLSKIDLAEGVHFSPLAVGAMGAQELATGMATLQPNAILPAHVHPVSEVIIPLSGTIHIFAEGRRYKVGQYDAFHVPAGLSHWIQNDLSNEPVSCFVSFATDQPSRDWVENNFTVKDCFETDSNVAEHLIRFKSASIYELSQGTLFRDLFAGRFGSKGICGGYGIFQPGASLPCHVHEFDESITIVEGAALCQVAGREYPLSNYDTACIPRERPHRFINRSENPMAMLWVYAGDEPDRTELEQCCCEECHPENQHEMKTS
ncbi:MAG: cupin domain-containing protein [Planctomycetes bacterium]|nr:cupin domain-containing protein [Planctomycetota bacterium]MCH9726396.1 cupin domain-containing protein [Planctomycetota bacterium]MCH9779181.1 cupin domain-containing protein [Planctomycetota bacterium]MCH9789339.1 cupin domain-containing protein [Planctomycetota bacterium]MDF1743021.1 cupin domain-containing protein [Gimesia sp.]